MMKALRPLAASILVLAATAGAVFAAPVTYTIDPSHSQVGFNVRHFFSRVPGRFNEFEGTVTYDDKDVTKSAVDVTIKTASIYTNNERRDNHLRSADFFAADSFPTITFKSTKITPASEGKYKVDGNLTIRGITKPVTLETSFLGAGNVGQAGMRAGWEASTTINRKDFNVLWNRTLDQGGTMLSDDVAIQIGVEGMKRPDNAAAPAAAAPATKK
jgi:polyisoprenoid-binding protein YceI